MSGPDPRSTAGDHGHRGQRRLRLDIAYDGTDLHGAAENPGVRTVAGVLRELLERVLGAPVALTLAGRTDAGVHATGQVVSFDAPADGPPADQVARAVTRVLGPEIVVTTARVVPSDFDARFSAVERRYRYRCSGAPVADPLTARTVWHVGEPLDRSAMRLACDPLIGEHDFSSFCRAPKKRPDASLVRRVRRLAIVAGSGGIVEVEVHADAFCHQMVRSIVGLVVAVGTGRRRAGEVSAILAARDRAAVPQVAPPHGLVLEHVRYPDVGAAGSAARR